MLETVRKYVRNYPFSVFCIALVWVLSLTPFIPETPLSHVRLIDKWTHFVMYGGTSLVIWWEYRRQHRRPDNRRLLLWGLLAPALMGGLLELLQEYATTTRSGEWLDAVADAVGALLGSALGLLLLHVGRFGSKDR